jgi:hypothetical protein
VTNQRHINRSVKASFLGVSHATVVRMTADRASSQAPMSSVGERVFGV